MGVNRQFQAKRAKYKNRDIKYKHDCGKAEIGRILPWSQEVIDDFFLMKFAQEMERVSLAKENIRLWCYTWSDSENISNVIFITAV